MSLMIWIFAIVTSVFPVASQLGVAFSKTETARYVRESLGPIAHFGIAHLTGAFVSLCLVAIVLCVFLRPAVMTIRTRMYELIESACEFWILYIEPTRCI